MCCLQDLHQIAQQCRSELSRAMQRWKATACTAVRSHRNCGSRQMWRLGHEHLLQHRLVCCSKARHHVSAVPADIAITVDDRQLCGFGFSHLEKVPCFIVDLPMLLCSYQLSAAALDKRDKFTGLKRRHTVSLPMDVTQLRIHISGSEHLPDCLK